MINKTNEKETVMKRAFLLLIAALASVTFLKPLSAVAGSDEVAKVNDSIEVFEQIMSIPEKGMPPSLLNRAQGIAIIPGMIKAGFIIGGRHGSGIIVIRNSEGGWSNPAFI